MIRMMDRLGHSVTVLAVVQNQSQKRDSEAYLADTKVQLRCFPAPAAKSLIERKIRSAVRSGWELAASDFGHAARREAECPYDVLLAEMPATARICEDDPRTVLSLHCLRHIDLTGVPERSIALVVEQMQARRAELSTCRRVPRIRTLSRRMESVLRTSGVASSIRVIPICIDPNLYWPVDEPAVPTVGVLGSMFWWPSRLAAKHFLERIAPRLKAACPSVHLLVGGWRAREVLGPYIRDNDVTVLDNFADPREAFSRLSVLVYAPPVGTGMKVKVLEAMAYGVPVVANCEGYEGLEADPAPPVRLAQTDDEIVDSTLELLRDAGVRRRAILEGMECVRRSFSPEPVTRALASFLEKKVT